MGYIIVINSASLRGRFAKIEQVHFVDNDDKTVPPALAQNFINAIPISNYAIDLVEQSVLRMPQCSRGRLPKYVPTQS